MCARLNMMLLLVEQVVHNLVVIKDDQLSWLEFKAKPFITYFFSSSFLLPSASSVSQPDAIVTCSCVLLRLKLCLSFCVYDYTINGLLQESDLRVCRSPDFLGLRSPKINEIGRMTAVSNAVAAVAVFSIWFSPLIHGRIAVTAQLFSPPGRYFSTLFLLGCWLFARLSSCMSAE